MIDSDGGHDTYSPPLCFEFLRDGSEAFSVRIKTEGTIRSLGSRSQACTRRRGIGDSVRRRIGRSIAGEGESGHERLYTT